jgi:hypothetical protein
MSFRKAIAFTVSAVVFAVCGAASIFLVASGYESVYNRSLPFVHTIDPIDMRAFADTYDLEAAASGKNDLYGNFGKPQTVKMPKRSSRMDIVAPLHDGKTWLARANTLQLLIPQKPRDGNLGLALLYCRSSFRTIMATELPAQGSNIFVDTDRDWRYVYKVTSSSVVAEAQPYVVADDGSTGKLVISCNDAEKNLNIVIEATLLSVQGKDV